MEVDFWGSGFECEEGEVENRDGPETSRLLVGESGLCRRGFDDEEAGALEAEGYRAVEEEGRERIVGSAKLAMAMEVLSRANAARVKKPDRVCFG